MCFYKAATYAVAQCKSTCMGHLYSDKCLKCAGVAQQKKESVTGFNVEHCTGFALPQAAVPRKAAEQNVTEEENNVKEQHDTNDQNLKEQVVPNKRGSPLQIILLQILRIIAVLLMFLIIRGATSGGIKTLKSQWLATDGETAVRSTGGYGYFSQDNMYVTLL